ncbi:MAG: zinc ABC transporter substrate-binding protein [Fimbriimonadales bacterium]|nr:zinc ABC transporter substrate-binding protein [Fimbriimonadales bacterium]MDW8051365.1 zinc ABC transporter substrate-binding protein [Armatimonadota bacterium]
MYAATLAVIADWIRLLELPVVLIQPRGADAHETSLTVRMVQQALRARRVIATGLVEGYLSTLERVLQGRVPIYRLVAYLQPPPEDGHIWLDVRYVRQCGAQILRWAAQDELISATQRQAWQRFQLQLRQIQVRIREARRTLRGKAYLATHDAYLPLARQLSMRSLGSLSIRGFRRHFAHQHAHPHPHEHFHGHGHVHEHDHGAMSTIAAMRHFITEARREGVAMILTPAPSPIATTLARTLRVPLVIADTLETPNPQHDYFARMLGLIEALERAARLTR